MDSLLFLLSGVMDDTKTKDALVKCGKDRGEAQKIIPKIAPGGLGSSLVTLPASGTKLTAQEIIEVSLDVNRILYASK